MAIDWERLDMERRIDEAKDDAYHAEKRSRERLAAYREEAEGMASDMNSAVANLQERVTALEAKLAAITEKNL